MDFAYSRIVRVARIFVSLLLLGYALTKVYPRDPISPAQLLNTKGDPLQSVYAGRPIQEDPTSPEATEIVMKWMKQCNEHANCTGELPPLPARVVDIGNEDNNGHIRLIETEGQTGKYISLSHCWGKAKQFTTTKASFAHHQAKIDHEHLPKSFKDAIAITRLLGVRYIWIDSICICQDDGEDWERESSKMTSIYMNSYLTIAASAAIDSSIGCFTPRRPPKYISIQYTSKQGTSGEIQAFLLPMRKEALPDLYIDMADNIGEVDHPLSTRAWAVQERVLPRRTLHFGKHQMYFECNEGFKGENGLHVPWRYHTIHSRQRNQFGLVMEEDKNTTIDLWRSLLWDYGSRNLTEPSDKLPAISGIARIIAEQLDDAYIAGMWRKSLLEDLLWQGLGVHRVSKYRAPSWSWASVDGTPAGGIYGKWEPVAEIIDHKVNLKGENIFGEVESGWIKIKAPLVRLILDPRVDPEGTGVPYDNNPKVKTEKGNHEGTYSRFDFGFSTSTGREQGVAMVESLKGVDIFALILVKKLPKSEDGEAYYCALIVRPAEGEDGAMQRVGFLDLDLDDLGECSQLENSEERPIVTLV